MSRKLKKYWRTKPIEEWYMGVSGKWKFKTKHLKDICSGLHLIPIKVGVGKKIPILIQRGDGKYYVSKSLTAERKKGNVTYVAISDHLFNKWGYERVIKAGMVSV